MPELFNSGAALVEAVLRGGYPEALSRTAHRRRTVWASQYIDALIQRDIRDLANINRLDHLPRFSHGLAHVSGQMCNFTQLGGQVGLDHKTAAKYTNPFKPFGTNTQTTSLLIPACWQV